MSDIFQSNCSWLGWPLLAALVACCAACGKTHSIATVPTEADANEIIQALSARKIEARKELAGAGHNGGGRRQQWQVFVSESLLEENKLAASLRILHEHGLPRPTDAGFEKAYEEGGMFPSESAQKAQRLKELKTEIERQLRHLPSVMRVSANIVMPEESSINIDPYPATASVLIVHKDEKPSFSGDYVKELVAKGVPKLKPEEVSVVLVCEPSPSAVVENWGSRTITVGRGNALWAGCVGVLAVLAALAAVLSLQWLRRRKELAGEAHTPPGQARLRRRAAAPELPAETVEKEFDAGPRAAATAEQLL